MSYLVVRVFRHICLDCGRASGHQRRRCVNRSVKRAYPSLTLLRVILSGSLLRIRLFLVCTHRRKMAAITTYTSAGHSDASWDTRCLLRVLAKARLRSKTDQTNTGCKPFRRLFCLYTRLTEQSVAMVSCKAF